MNLDWKNKFISFLKENLKNDLGEIENNLTALKESRNKETKSVVGDKYETSRQMLQQEIDKKEKVLSNKYKMYNSLLQIKEDTVLDVVQFGALIQSNGLLYFLGIPLGQIEFNEQKIWCISSVSPLGKVLSGLQKGESAEFRNQTFTIESVL